MSEKSVIYRLYKLLFPGAQHFLLYLRRKVYVPTFCMNINKRISAFICGKCLACLALTL